MKIKKRFKEYVLDENGLPKSYPSFGTAYIAATNKGSEWTISGVFGIGYYVSRTVIKSVDC